MSSESNNKDQNNNYDLASDELEDLVKCFKSLDTNNNGYIEPNELRDALKMVGLDLPAFKVRDIVDSFKKADKNKDGKLSLDEFQELYTKLRLQGRLTQKKDLKTETKLDTKHSDSGYHSIRHSERFAFTKWINQNLANDPDLNLAKNPINPEDEELYKRCDDGILLCKLINFSVPNTIDERAINKGKLKIYQELENLELALNSAEAIGCHIVSIRPADIKACKEYLIMGLLWQIIQIGLFAEINLTVHPGLVALLKDGETTEDLLKLTKEALLLRWMNYHLSRSGYTGKEVQNFSGDIKDSIAYIHLLNQIAPKNYEPKVTTGALNESDVTKRAEKMLYEAEKLKVREFVSANDVTNGIAKLNMAFVANLFNTYPALDTPVEGEAQIIEETREEKTYRNWINSMGCNPYVNYLYTDLQDCLVIFQLYDMIKPNCVDWSKVVKTFHLMKQKFEKLSNCNYAIECGKKELDFKLVGIQGSNLQDGDKTYTLALVWQLMRAYTLSMLQKIAGQGHPIVENGIIEWTNNKLKEAGKKTSISSFQDQSISDSRVICDLVDSIKPQSIKYDLIKTENSRDAKMDNARYALAIARKIGARVFALPEDIVEVKPKMVMTIFATLMIKDYQPKQQPTLELDRK